MTDDPDPLIFAARMARRAGAMIVEGLAADFHERRAKSSTTDITTATDSSVQRLLVEEIQHYFPNDSILAEENAVIDGDNSRKWIIDPLDGTSNFVRGLWPSVVSIGVESDGVIDCGVVFDPVHDELFSARRGAGAFLNGSRLEHRSDVVELSEAFVSTGLTDRVHPQPRRSEIVRKLVPQCDSVRDLGATALQLCYVAAGRYDAHVALGVQRWDVVAGFVVATEAGCLAEGLLPNSPATEDAAIVAVPSLMPALRSLAL